MNDKGIFPGIAAKPVDVEAIHRLRQAAWRNEIAAIWRLTRINGVTRSFQNELDLIDRQTFGFCNF